MESQVKQLYIGSLLHDVGKILYRAGDGRNHSTSGADFLTEQQLCKPIEYCARFHHAKAVKGAKIPDDALAYIVYFADNISAKSDRRSAKDVDGEGDENSSIQWDKEMPISSVFNILNGNNGNNTYPDGSTLEEGLPFASPENNKYTQSSYSKIAQNLRKHLHPDIEVNELLDILEANTSFVPSSTNKAELADISLFDHAKTTAAISACIYQYLQASNHSPKERCFDKEMETMNENMFLLFSCDFSGIQDFIYTSSGQGALKSLRTRSFYLEIMLEHVMDELLEALNLARPNLLYTGGGHAYALLPNTKAVKNTIEIFNKKIKQWFLENFNTALYIASAYSECNGKELAENIGEVYKRVSKNLSAIKISRYTAEDIKYLNSQRNVYNERECAVCHRTDRLTQDDDSRDICSICKGIVDISLKIARSKVFMIVDKATDASLPLPNDKHLVVSDKLEDCERFYIKNNPSAGEKLSRNIWMGDTFAKGEYGEPLDFGELAKGEGIRRLGVIRADVDNLGKAFSQGFSKDHSTISRSTTLSRSLSLFFKYHINQIVKDKKATIVYSGGDDVFIVGNWQDVIEISMDLQSQFSDFTSDTLTLSAGIGMYHPKYPFMRAALITGELEEAAKAGDKNQIALFESNNVFTWEDFKNEIWSKKLPELEKFFRDNSEQGKSFIYRIIEHLRQAIDEKGKKDDGTKGINLARFVYLLARSVDRKVISAEDMKLLYEYTKNEKDTKELLCALEIYVYRIREDE